MHSLLSPRILVSFIGVILLVSAVSFLYLISSRQLSTSSGEVESIHKKINSIGHLVSLLKDIERGQEGFIISRDDAFLEPYSSALLTIDGQIEKIDKLLESDVHQQKEFTKLKILIAQKVNEAKITVDYMKGGMENEARAMVAKMSGKELMEKILKDAGEIEKVETQKLASVTHTFNASSRGNLIIILGGLTVTLSVILLGVRKILKELKYRQHLESELFYKNQELSDKNRTAFIDNTELQKAIKDKEKFLEAHEIANKELEAFSYSISHDLRAPLRSINGFGNILKNEYYDKLDGEGKRYLDIILHNAKQMGNLIDDLLEFAKLGKKGMNKSYFNMEELIAEVLDEILISSPASKKAKIEIGPLPFVTADRNLLKQVWINLINNSLKFSANRIQPEISIFSEAKDEDWNAFYIRDNGVGFDSKYIDKIFNVFQRLHSYEEFEGTGVGLAIVQRIIISHGGKVGAESNLGEGATFYFTLSKT